MVRIVSENPPGYVVEFARVLTALAEIGQWGPDCTHPKFVPSRGHGWVLQEAASLYEHEGPQEPGEVMLGPHGTWLVRLMREPIAALCGIDCCGIEVYATYEIFSIGTPRLRS